MRKFDLLFFPAKLLNCKYSLTRVAGAGMPQKSLFLAVFAKVNSPAQIVAFVLIAAADRAWNQ